MQRAHRILGSAYRFAALVLSLPVHAAATEPPPASTEAVAESERQAASAFEAYTRKQYASAVELYLKALAAAPSADILYNLARVHDLGLRDRARASEYYARYVADPGAVPARIELALRRLAELRAAEDAARVPVAAGTPDRAVASAAPAAAPSGPPARAPAASPRAPAADADSALGAGALAAGALGLVGVGIGVGFGLAARSDLQASERDCEGERCSTQAGVDAARDAEREADIATVGFAVGGALLALGTAFWLLGDESAEPPASSELELEPRLGVGELALSISGRFGP